jgi:lipopolysaccharide transport system permease protein
MISLDNTIETPQTKAEKVTEKKWLLEIRPKANLFDLHLKDLWRYRDLISMFIYREFNAQYKQTVLGPLWFLIQPILTTITFIIIFGRVAKISTNGIPHILFYMSGLILWNFFATSFTKVSDTFSTNKHIFGKVYFPRLAAPISIVISTSISFGIQFLLFTAIWVYYKLQGTDIGLSSQTLILPVLVLLTALLGLGCGLIVSSFTNKYRDLKFLLTFGIQLLMYATPVIYPLSALPEKYRTLILINPVCVLVENFRYALLGKGTYEPAMLVYSSITTCVILILGMIIFNREEKHFMDVV